MKRDTRDITVTGQSVPSRLDLERSKELVVRGLRDLKPKTRIMLVDDEESVYQLMKEEVEDLLPDYDIDLIYFDRTRKALDSLQKNQVDLIISCINLPEGTGIDLLRECQRLCPSAPFMFHSAYSEYKSFFEGLGVPYVVKSSNWTELASVMKRLLARKPDK